MHFKTKIIVAIIAMAFVSLSVSARKTAASIYDQTISDEDKYYLPPSLWLNIFSMGYNEAAADLLWVKTVIYFAEAAKKNTSVSRAAFVYNKKSVSNYTVNYILSVVSLDPKFIGAYQHGARLILYHEGQISKKSVLMAMDVLKQGIKEFPNNGQLFFNLGFLYYWEIVPLLKTEEEKKLSRETGARLIKAASTMSNVPGYTGMLAKTLLTRQGLDELVIEHLKTMLANETEPHIRKLIERQLIEALGMSARQDIALMKKLQKKWIQNYHFVPFDIYSLIFSTVSPEESANPLFVIDKELFFEDEKLEDEKFKDEKFEYEKTAVQ